MEDKINQSEHVETVADLRKSISRSFIGRTRVRIMAVISRVKRSTQDYRIPVMASTIFVVLILSIAIVRQFQKTTVLAIINQATNGTNDYATLLSIDKTDEFIAETAGEPERDSSGTLITSGNSTQSTSTSFVINDTSSNSDSGNTGSTTSSGGSSGGSTSGGGSSGGGSSGGGSSGGGSTGGGTDPTPPPPFSASISSFTQGVTKLDCKNPLNPKAGNCTKVYSFSARVGTSDGPGSVSYSWQSSQGNTSGSFSAGEGSAITSVTRDISLACNKPVSFTIQFNITSPSVSNSDILTVNHDCNEL